MVNTRTVKAQTMATHSLNALFGIVLIVDIEFFDLVDRRNRGTIYQRDGG